MTAFVNNSFKRSERYGSPEYLVKVAGDSTEQNPSVESNVWRVLNFSTHRQGHLLRGKPQRFVDIMAVIEGLTPMGSLAA